MNKYSIINLSAPALHTQLSRPRAKLEKALGLLREIEGVLIECPLVADCDIQPGREKFFVLDMSDPFTGMALFGYMKAINDRAGAVDIETDAGQAEVEKLNAQAHNILGLIQIAKGGQPPTEVQPAAQLPTPESSPECKPEQCEAAPAPQTTEAAPAEPSATQTAGAH